MRTHSKALIATGAAAVMLLTLSACGPTASEDDPTDVPPGVEQPQEPAQPGDVEPGTPEVPAPGDETSDSPEDNATDMPGEQSDDTSGEDAGTTE